MPRAKKTKPKKIKISVPKKKLKAKQPVRVREITAGLVFGWIFIVAFLIGAIFLLKAGSTLFGILIIILTILLIPQINMLFSKIKFRIGSGLKLVIVLVILFLFGWFAWHNPEINEFVMGQFGKIKLVEPTVPGEMPPEIMPGEEAAPAVAALIANAQCINKQRIQAVITNNGDAPAEILEDITILFNGIVVKTVSCDKLTLAPGEGTVCSDISGGYPIIDQNEIYVRSEKETSVVEVLCGGVS